MKTMYAIPKILSSETREQFLKMANQEYQLFKIDESSWKEEQQELREWDMTLADGLPDK